MDTKQTIPIPLNPMQEGDAVPFPSSSSSVSYEVRLRGGVYYCTCQGWKVCKGAKDRKTCKHLKEHLGEEFDAHRTGVASNPKKRKADSKTSCDDEPKKKKIVVDVLLANKWTEEIDPTGYWMSEKLDGVRALWNGDQFYSRNGNIFYSPDYFRKGLPANEKLDGELFLARDQFNETISIVSSHDMSERWKNLVFRVRYLLLRNNQAPLTKTLVFLQVFDIPSQKTKPFEERVEMIQKICDETKSKHLEAVQQTKCKNRQHLDAALDEILKQKGEGVMLRQSGSLYEPKRSSTLLKVKTFMDAEAIVIGHKLGKNKYAKDMGALECQFHDDEKKAKKKITFYVGSGFTDEQRKDPPKIGTVITFKYQELTKAGVPRFPIFVGVPIDR